MRETTMRRKSTAACLVAGALALVPGGPARGQFVGPSFGVYGQPSGLYKSVGVPGMGPGAPSVMLYFPGGGSGPSFTPSPMNYSVAGVQVPVAGTSGSVYLPNGTVAGPR